MSVRGLDLGSLVAGIVLIGLGTLLLLDSAGTLELSFGYLWPLLLGAVGAILLALGLTRNRRG